MRRSSRQGPANGQAPAASRRPGGVEQPGRRTPPRTPREFVSSFPELNAEKSRPDIPGTAAGAAPQPPHAPPPPPGARVMWRRCCSFSTPFASIWTCVLDGGHAGVNEDGSGRRLVPKRRRKRESFLSLLRERARGAMVRPGPPARALEMPGASESDGSSSACGMAVAALRSLCL